MAVEVAQRLVDDGFLDVARRGLAEDRQQGRHHSQAAAVSVLQDLAGLLLESCVDEPLSGLLRLAGVEDVQIPAAAAEGDDLTTERANDLHVVGAQIAQHERLHAVAGEPDRHAGDGRRLPEAGLAEHEQRRVADELRALEPRNRVAAQRRPGVNVAAERHAHHRSAGTDRVRPQAAHLNGRAAPLGGRLQVVRHAAAGAAPPARGERPGRRRRARIRVLPAGAHEQQRTDDHEHDEPAEDGEGNLIRGHDARS